MTNHVELNCADYELKSGSIGHSLAGSVFRCTISPISNEVLASLAAAARSAGTIRLLFPKRPVLLEFVEVERIEPMSVRVGGRIVDSQTRREEQPIAATE